MRKLNWLVLYCLFIPFYSWSSTVVEPRIINGKLSEIDDWPYMVAIVAKNSSALFGQFCAGTLYKQKYVITAAHCLTKVTKDDIELVVGIHTLSKEADEGIRLAAKKFRIHEAYEARSLRNDIAIIELERQVLSIEAPSVVLAPANKSQEMVEDSLLTVVGWGTQSPTGSNTRSDGLMQVNVNYKSDSTCAANPAFANVGADNFCAGRPEINGYDSCRGDSGGPIVYAEKGVYKQLGIVSWGSYQCGDINTYGVYTDISYFSKWIEKQTSGVIYPQDIELGYKSLGAVTYILDYQNNTQETIYFDSFNIVVEGSGDANILENGCYQALILPQEWCSVTVNSKSWSVGDLSYQVNARVNTGKNIVTLPSVVSINYRNKADDELLNLLPNNGNISIYLNDNPWEKISNGLQSGDVSNNELSELVITGLSKGALSLDIQISSERYFDKLNVSLNGKLLDSLSGEIEESRTIQFHNENNTLKFEYYKNDSISDGQDTVYLRNFRLNESSEVPSSESSSVNNSADSGGGAFNIWLVWLLMFRFLVCQRVPVKIA